METENEDALGNEQEVIPQEESLSEVANEDSVNLSKSEYTKLKRQALAYQANKGAEVKVKTETTPSLSEDRFKELELKMEGYNREEIDLIKEVGFEKLNSPVLKKAIETMRSERKSKEADEVISTKSNVYQKYTDNDFKNMSVEDMRKILPHAE